MDITCHGHKLRLQDMSTVFKLQKLPVSLRPDLCLHQFLIRHAGLVEPAPYLIRGHPEDHVKIVIPAFAGMTIFGFRGLEIKPCVNVMADLKDSSPVVFTDRVSINIDYSR
jgi:hypothetical protein